MADPAASDGLEDRLAGERALPRADFRRALQGALEARDPGYGSRPSRLRLTVTLWIGAGGVLLAAGVLQAVGAG